jgi:hypothetical protein
VNFCQQNNLILIFLYILSLSTQETVEDTSSEGVADADKVVRRRRRLVKIPKSVVNPDENFYFYWLMVLTICILYNLWTLIVRQSFPELQVPRTHAGIFTDGLVPIKSFSLSLSLSLSISRLITAKCPKLLDRL